MKGKGQCAHQDLSFSPLFNTPGMGPGNPPSVTKLINVQSGTYATVHILLMIGWPDGHTFLRTPPVPYWFNGRLPCRYPILYILSTGRAEQLCAESPNNE